MKTWFNKETQMWESEVPKIFWVGEVDYITGEKIYSCDRWEYKGDDYSFIPHAGFSRMTNAQENKLYKNSGVFPYHHIYGRGRYSEVICKKLS